jgi:hypothetical protein
VSPRLFQLFGLFASRGCLVSICETVEGIRETKQPRLYIVSLMVRLLLSTPALKLECSRILRASLRALRSCRGLTAPLCAQTPGLPKELENGCYFNATKGTGVEPMTTTNTKLELNWQNVLTEAVTKPRKILAALSLFHNYSLQMQCWLSLNAKCTPSDRAQSTRFPTGKH